MGQLKLFLETAFFEQVIDEYKSLQSKDAWDESLQHYNAFFMLLQSRVVVYFNCSKAEFIDKTRTNSYYKQLFKKELEGQLNLRFDASIENYKPHINDKGLILTINDDLNMTNPNFITCRVSNILNDFKKVFFAGTFKMVKKDGRRKDLINKITALIGHDNPDIIFNDPYLIDDKNQETSLDNLHEWTSQLSNNQGMNNLFISSKYMDIQTNYQDIFDFCSSKKLGIINGNIHNRFALNNLSYVKCGHGFDAFYSDGVSKRNDEFDVRSVFNPKKGAFTNSDYELYVDYKNEIRDQIKNCKEKRFQNPEMEGDIPDYLAT